MIWTLTVVHVCYNVRFSGLFCEFSPPMVLPRTSPCDNHECLNGAQCVIVGSDPRCQCLHGYEGERCETLTSVNFVNRESYLQLPSSLLSPQTNISLQVTFFKLNAALHFCFVSFQVKYFWNFWNENVSKLFLSFWPLRVNRVTGQFYQKKPAHNNTLK